MPRFTVRDSKKSIRFDGVDDAVTLPIVPSLTAFGFMAWVKMPLATASDRLIDYSASGPNGGFNVVLTPSGGSTLPTFTIYNAGSAVAAISYLRVLNGRWTHLAGTYAVNAVNAYKDTTLMGTDTSAEMTAPAAQLLTIGKRSSGATNFYEGLMDEFVFVNNRVLTIAEIQDHYYKGLVPADAQVHLEFVDNVLDSSRFDNDGTAAGTPAYVTDRPFALRTAS